MRAENFNPASVCPESGRGTFVDERDGQAYKYTTIGDQVWMAENLNYETDYSVCYDNGDSDCDFWGRYYALQENDSYILNWNKVDTICPIGWHLPSNEEWSQMIDVIGKYQDKTTALRLKSTSSLWDESRGKGNDECGFSVIPSGYLYNSGIVNYIYYGGSFWSSTMKDAYGAYEIGFDRVAGNINSTDTHLLSIRCIKD
ncbi:FISUMP domain-containing protein [uncultured Fibrobacter sp.]|uniref:FISUMP domain-containing protein n=1 Tax=uncultured Fibrobacter sp. TaxID=261512 RepID=UPI002803996B|nr:FISUMP domain-containing protein [uncultured Fibrobacter sp.]